MRFVLPRRGVLALLSTIIGLVLLLGFKTPQPILTTGVGIVARGSNPARSTAPIALGPGAGRSATTNPPATAIPSPASQTSGILSAAGPSTSPSAGSTTKPVLSTAQAGKRANHAATPRPARTPPPAPPTAAPTPHRTPTPTPAAFTGSVTGPVVATPFGDVQVRATLSSGKLVDVQPLQMPSDATRSQMIAQYAAPILRSEALTAQSAQINLVSGATYTSEGYAQSLQAALDQARR